MWKPGTPVTLAATDTAEQLTSSVGLVKAIKFRQYWNNANRIYWGNSTLAPTTPTGVLGWLQPPSGALAPVEDVEEQDAPNGINANDIYVAGTAGEVILWSYLEQ